MFLVLGGCTKKFNTLEKKEETESKVKTSLKELITKAKPVKCTYKLESENGGTSGITYVFGGKVRSDFVQKIPGEKDIESHFIKDGDWTYTWSSTSESGIKVKREDESDDYPDEGEGKVNYKDMDTEMDYSCKGWLVDNSVFEIPKNIEFKDLNAEMNKAKESMKSMCGTCEMISDEKEKLECRESLRCDE